MTNYHKPLYLTIFIGLSLLLLFLTWTNGIASEDQSHSDKSGASVYDDQHKIISESNQNEHGSDGHGNSDHECGSNFHKRYDEMSRNLPLWSSLPFIGVLLSIALFPQFPSLSHVWHKYYPQITVGWAILFAIPFLFIFKSLALFSILEIYLLDYIPFIVLLWGLYTVTSGMITQGDWPGTPARNTILLAAGAIMAPIMGTTGASMLMIRPILGANKFRKKGRRHIIIFFIFIVSNIGGSLTPLGDPPLFLGFLHGVPFFWTFNLVFPFLTSTVILLAAFYMIDKLYFYKREMQNPESVSLLETAIENAKKGPVRLGGLPNLLTFTGIIMLVIFSGTVKLDDLCIMGVHLPLQNVIRDCGIILMGVLSYFFITHKKIFELNKFTWFPIKEVGWLFFGIFMTIIPMLAMLSAGTDGAMGFIVRQVKDPVHYLWITGLLSSFLDNAPTYLTFFQLSLGRLGISEDIIGAILNNVIEHPMAEQLFVNLKAISIGAVFFGALTYIGNAPNFMVRSIAKDRGVHMPEFFAYMKWSFCLLMPVFTIITFIYFMDSLLLGLMGIPVYFVAIIIFLRIKKESKSQI